MPTQKLTQNSFVNGQYDRTAQNQENTQGGLVSTGLSYARNIVSGDKMEARKRLGTKLLKQLDDVSVLVPYRYGENDILLVFSDKKLDLFSVNNEEFSSFVGVEKVEQFIQDWTSNTTNGYTISDSNNSTDLYKIFKSVGGNTIGATKNGYEIVFKVPTEVSLNKFYFQFKTAVSHLPGSVKHGGWRGFRKAVLLWSDNGVDWTLEPSYITKPDGSDGVSLTQNLDSVGRPAVMYTHTWYTTFNISPKLASSHKYWKVVFSEYSPVSDADESMTYSVSSEIWVQSLSQSSSQTTEILVDALKNIKYDQFSQHMKITSTSSPAYKFSIANGLIDFGQYTPSDPSDLFADTKFGQPTCVSYFQNRLWLSGFKNYPATVLASKFGEENKFTKSSTLQFDDYLELTCNQLKNRITNIVGSQNVLYCFSEDGISFVDGGSNGIIATNQSIEFHLKNRMPAGNATPTFKDDVLLYASADGTKLYAVDYDLVVERFNVEDLAKYAKDVTRAKIKELHYLNDESQLIYGLCQDDSMFALMYKKGQYNGFFPFEIQDGFIYDMCPVKIGNKYKLLMVTNRSGSWYLEEKLDEGVFIDTSSVLLSKEDKKWATYDNIENNIALDCYKTYENALYGKINVDGDVVETTVDLEKYVGQTVMFSQENSKDFLQAEIKSVSKSKLYCWTDDRDTPENGTYWFTNSSKPNENDILFSESGEQVFVVLAYVEDDGYGNEYITCRNIDSTSTIFPGYTLYRYKTKDYVKINAIIQKLAQRGDSNYYNTVLFPFDNFETDFSAGTEIGVISQGRYLGEFIVPDNGVIQLPFEVHKITYGATYLARGIIKIQQPYESMKQVQQIAVSVLNTGHLEIGTSLGDMLELEKIKDDSHLDLTTITMNGSYVLVPSDTPEWEKNIIFQSRKGLPFTVNCIEAIVNYSNMGGK